MKNFQINWKQLAVLAAFVVLFFLLMALFERYGGMKADTIGILFVSFTVVIYAVIGWLSRTMQVDAYYVAGRQVPDSSRSIRSRPERPPLRSWRCAHRATTLMPPVLSGSASSTTSPSRPNDW